MRDQDPRENVLSSAVSRCGGGPPRCDGFPAYTKPLRGELMPYCYVIYVVRYTPAVVRSLLLPIEVRSPTPLRSRNHDRVLVGRRPDEPQVVADTPRSARLVGSGTR